MNSQHREMSESSLVSALDGTRHSLTAQLGNLYRWTKAGDNEVFLRQLIDATLTPTQTGYSIAHFDFLIYFKHADIHEDKMEAPIKYMRKLILSEYVSKVRTNLKYQNFHRRHEAMIKLWQQLVRVVSIESQVVDKMTASKRDKFEEVMQNASDDDDSATLESPETPLTNTKSAPAVSADKLASVVGGFAKRRVAILRAYMMHCQSVTQSKTQQCAELKKIFGALLNIELAQEKVDTIEDNMTLAAFSRLWNSRYNTQNRIVINASSEQLDARAAFVRSAHRMLYSFEDFTASPLNNYSVTELVGSLSSFIGTNNTANNYNVNVQSLQSSPFARSRASMSKATFIAEVLPLLRDASQALGRVAHLQSNVHLSLYESFWDVSFTVMFFYHMTCLLSKINFVDPNASSMLASLEPNSAALLTKKRKKMRKIQASDSSSSEGKRKSTKRLLKRIKRLIHD